MLLSAISWRTVRVFGGLQVLTKASYIMLLFVPLLAAVWPVFRGYINRYNQDLFEHQSAAADLMLTLEEIQTGNIPQGLNAGLDPAIYNIQQVINQLEKASFSNSDMPSVWAIAFFSSLLVVIGHAIYESFAPELVKKFSQEEYAAFELTRYSNHPTEVQLEEARKIIMNEISTYNERLNVPPGWDSFDDNNAPRLAWSQQESNPLDTISLAANIQYERALGAWRVNIKSLVKETPFERILTGEVGSSFFSRAYWRVVRDQWHSMSNIAGLLSPMVISFAAYFIALVGLFWIILRQSVTVMEAANWNVPVLIYSLANLL